MSKKICNRPSELVSGGEHVDVAYVVVEGGEPQAEEGGEPQVEEGGGRLVEVGGGRRGPLVEEGGGPQEAVVGGEPLEVIDDGGEEAWPLTTIAIVADSDNPVSDTSSAPLHCIHLYSHDLHPPLQLLISFPLLFLTHRHRSHTPIIALVNHPSSSSTTASFVFPASCNPSQSFYHFF
ncbi:hypothetical protein L2E82_39104 [Cichorium intybus]|uniref:Uncharacterized protein n=1 Tax=Cichorium intybus TaxID=13427 RepID=A0ACB9AI97_CICIN|nr:hypothetical protein L2E82_39104 [Cichorium intybus]